MNEYRTKVLIETPRGRGVVQIDNTIGKGIPLNSVPVAVETLKYPVVTYNPKTDMPKMEVE